MSKYNKYFPKLDDKKINEISGRVNMRAETISAVYGNPDYSNSAPKYDYSLLQNKWAAKNIDLLDVVHFGVFSARELLEKLGFELKEKNKDYNRHLVEALSELYDGAVVMNYGDDGKPYIDISDNNSAADLTEDFAHQHLTKWDKFWGFFGIKTNHAKDVAAHNDMIDHTKHSLDRFEGKICGFDNKKTVDAILNDKESFDSCNKACDQFYDSMNLWNKAFFGDTEKPLPPFTLSNGKEVDALSMCIAIYNKTPENKPITSVDFNNLTDIDKNAFAKAVNEYKYILKADYAIDGFGKDKFKDDIINSCLDKEFIIPTENGKVTMESAAKAYPLLRAKSNFRLATGNKEFTALKDDETFLKSSSLIRTAVTSRDVYNNLNNGEYKKAMDSYNKYFKKEEKVTDYAEFFTKAKNLIKNTAEIAKKAPEEEIVK